MTDYLSADELMKHVKALSVDIGPRPPGSLEEAQARAYIRDVMKAHGLTDLHELPFTAPDSWGYAGTLPFVIAFAANMLGKGKMSRLVGALATLGAAFTLWKMFSAQRSPLEALVPNKPTATLVFRVAAKNETKHKLVLIGHTDTNKHRLTFMPQVKREMIPLFTYGLGALVINGLAQLVGVTGLKIAEPLRQMSLLSVLAGIGIGVADELGGFVDGANDNATAVACLLGLGAKLQAQPLENTEVWLAFTGAEESGCLGIHALMDTYGAELANAWFLDFEMVGAGELVYVTEHSGFSYFNAYVPDDESLQWALETARAHPEMSVRGAPMTIVEEIGALRGRGYRGICLAGQGADGWLVNWHQYSDNIANIQPEAIAKAARFAWAMMEKLDTK
ncbi:MAG: M28 family peptidase [Chloroflexi bacterium]|nr:M28 family peptidase [Chloroflexota bacterium]